MLKFLSGFAFGVFIVVTANNPQAMKNFVNKAVDATHDGVAATVETVKKPEESTLVIKSKEFAKEVTKEVAPK